MVFSLSSFVFPFGRLILKLLTVSSLLKMCYITKYRDKILIENVFAVNRCN